MKLCAERKSKIRNPMLQYPRWKMDWERRLLREFALPLNRKVKAYSKGMRTKLALLLSLARGVDLLIGESAAGGIDCGEEGTERVGLGPYVTLYRKRSASSW
jgi:hypothetical protein